MIHLFPVLSLSLLQNQTSLVTNLTSSFWCLFMPSASPLHGRYVVFWVYVFLSIQPVFSPACAERSSPVVSPVLVLSSPILSRIILC